MERWTTKLVREPVDGPDLGELQGPHEIAGLFHKLYGNPPQEHLVAFYLNGRNEVVGTELVTKGTLNQSPVHPRGVFRPAILANATAVVIAHNHPSGNSRPSEADKKTTKALTKAADIVGIPLLDHVIVGTGEYSAASEGGWLADDVPGRGLADLLDDLRDDLEQTSQDRQDALNKHLEKIAL